MHTEAKEQLRVWFKLNVLEYGKILCATEALWQMPTKKTNLYG